MKYVNIGTDTLLKEYMNTVMDTDIQVKPAGGLWCTDCHNELDIPWVNYMLRKPGVFFRKAPKDNPFLQKGVLLSLKTGAKIFQLNGEEGREILGSKYKTSYEELSKYYDGVYVDVIKIFGRDAREKEENFRLFSVSSLLLFNLDCIDSYQKMTIDIEPFDYFDYYDEPDYTTIVSPEKYHIQPVCSEYLQLVEDISIRFRNFILTERNKYPNVSTNRIAYLLYSKIVETYKRDIEELCKKKHFDQQKLTYSLTSNATSRVK